MIYYNLRRIPKRPKADGFVDKSNPISSSFVMDCKGLLKPNTVKAFLNFESP